MKSYLVILLSIFALTIGIAFSRDSFAESPFIQPTLGPADVEEKMGPIKECGIFIPLLNIPEAVSFRLKVLTSDDGVVAAFTVAAVDFRVSNGIPYEPEKKSVTSARILANTFDSDKVSSRVDTGDGSVAYGFRSYENLFSLLELIGRGGYLVTFKRTDRTDKTTYVVEEKIDEKIIGEFLTCMGKTGAHPLAKPSQAKKRYQGR